MSYLLNDKSMEGKVEEVEEVEEDVVGILFDSMEDQQSFFSQFCGVGSDGKSVHYISRK